MSEQTDFDAKAYADHLVKKILNPVIASGIPTCYKDADEWAFDFFCGDFPYNHYEEVCDALLVHHQLTLEAFKKATGFDLAENIKKARDYEPETK